MESIRVLVTGVGGGVGQGIIKALRMATLPVRIVGADITPIAAGMYWSDESVLIPPVEECGAYEAIVAVLRQKRIDALMVGSEYDLAFFAEHRADIEHDTGTTVIVASLHSIQLAADKWLTMQFLRDNGLPFADATLPRTVDEALAAAQTWGFPIVLKPRTGTSSSHVHIVTDAAELVRCFDHVPRPMVQRLAGEPCTHLHQEMTCSVFRCADGTFIGPFTARRTLRGGDSWTIEVARTPEIHPVLLSIAEKFAVPGSLNVQLMNGPDGAVPFEVNARFSGSTAIRAHFGFNEPEMALRSFLLDEAIDQPSVGEGMCLRFMEETYLDGVHAEEMMVAAKSYGLQQ